MIIEDLIRLGKVLLDNMPARDVLELVSGFRDIRVKNFFRHVWVVELGADADDRQPAVLPMQIWGQDILREGSRGADFKPDARAVAAPFVFPGGNPIHPQGRYGAAVYPCFEKHLEGFRNSAEDAKHFLAGRLARTLGFDVQSHTLDAIANGLHHALVSTNFAPKEKPLGVLVLVRCDADAPFHYSEPGKLTDDERRAAVGESRKHQGQLIVPDYRRLLQCFWRAKLEEGAEKGTRQGACSITGRGEQAISPYCKAWPFAPLEWNCPLPHGGDEKMLVEGIGLCDDAYRALVAGASAFGRLTQPVDTIVLREIFSPVADGPGRNQASRRKGRKLPRIFGGASLLPLLDSFLRDPDWCEGFVSNLRNMFDPCAGNSPLADRHMEAVTGFDIVVPEEFESEAYRLTLIYYHGDPGRGDVHLRCCIEDVIPTTIGNLRKIGERAADSASALMRALMRGMMRGLSEKGARYRRKCYRSVPYMLARAYGGAHLWTQLERCLRRLPLDLERPTANAARRMATLVPLWPKSRFDIADEALFFLSFLSFLECYDQNVAAKTGGFAMPMRAWKDLYNIIINCPVEELRFENAAELGFGCGVLTAWFGRKYWKATGGKNGGQDFLKHRVLTFGSNLSPEDLWRRGVSKFFDIAARVQKFQMSTELKQRTGIVLAEYDRLRVDVGAKADEFMSAFWSGYAIYGYDLKKKLPTQQTEKEAASAAGGEA